MTLELWLDELAMIAVDYFNDNPDDCIVEIPIPSRIFDEYEESEIAELLPWLSDIICESEEFGDDKFLCSVSSDFDEIRIERCSEK